MRFAAFACSSSSLDEDSEALDPLEELDSDEEDLEPLLFDDWLSEESESSLEEEDEEEELELDDEAENLFVYINDFINNYFVYKKITMLWVKH